MGRKKGSKNKIIKSSGNVFKDIECKNPEKKLEEVDKKISNKQTFKEINPKLKKITNELTKQFGHEVIHFASEEEPKERIPIGIEAIDKLITGFPAGAFSIIWGNKGCTKTTTTYYLISEAQKLGKQCLYLDLEHSYDNEWAKKCGIDINKLLYAGNFDNAEQAMDTVIKMCNEKVIDVVVLDSVNALSPKAEQEEKSGKKKSLEDNTMALLARKMSDFFRISGTGVYRGKVTFILIGQARIDLGTFVKLEKLSGGKALGFYASIIIKAYKAGRADAPHYKFKAKKEGKCPKCKKIITEKNKIENNKYKCSCGWAGTEEELKYEYKSFPIGAQICYRLEKKKISYCAPEETEIRQDFYNEFGFKKPSDKEIEELYADWIEMENEENESK